jgi:N-methylhydantoinase A
VYFLQTGSVTCPLYDRDGLRAGNEILGPAIIEQYDSTTVVNPGWSGQVDPWGTLVLSKVETS